VREAVVEGHGQSEVAIMDTVDYRITSTSRRKSFGSYRTSAGWVTS